MDPNKPIESETIQYEHIEKADDHASETRDSANEAGTHGGFGDSFGQPDNQENTWEQRRSGRSLDATGPDKAASKEVICPDDDDRWYQLGFIIARSLRYHAKRRSFFERCNHSVRAISALAGAATVASVIKDSHWATITAGIVVAIATSLDLVFDFSKRAMVYDTLYKQFADLGIKVASAERTDENYRLFIVGRLLIEKEEPTLLIALNAICYNEELKSRGFNYSYKIGRLQRMFCQYFDIGEPKFERVETGA